MGYHVIRTTGEGTKESPLKTYAWSNRKDGWAEYSLHPLGKTYTRKASAERKIAKLFPWGDYGMPNGWKVFVQEAV